MDYTLLLAFWGLAALLICTPGADWAYLISAGLRGRGVQAVSGMVVGHCAIALAVALGLAAVVSTHAWMLTVISVVGGLYLLWLGTSALQSLLRERRAETVPSGDRGDRGDGAPRGCSGTRSHARPRSHDAEGARDNVGDRGVIGSGDPVVAPGGEPGDGYTSVAVKPRVRALPSKRTVTLQGMSVSLLNPKVYLMFLALVPQFVSDAAPMSDAMQLIVLGVVHVITCGIIYLAVSLGAGAILISRPRAATVVTGVSGVVMSVLGVVVILEVML